MDYSQKARVVLGRKIKQLRVEKNLSQSYLAEKTELNRAYLSALENGKKNVTLDVLCKIALCLEVPLSELFEASRDEKIENKVLRGLFLSAGFFSTLRTVSKISSFGIIGNILRNNLDSGIQLLSDYVESQKKDQKNKSE